MGLIGFRAYWALQGLGLFVELYRLEGLGVSNGFGLTV